MADPTTNQALVLVDVQRCFMPTEEGQRLGDVEGFGELGVEGGQNVVAPLNELTLAFNEAGQPVFTTQDQHPEETAHFSDTPNFVNTWTKHGRAGTPGGELHPELLARLPQYAARLIKGDVVATSPEDDTSYTGALAHNKNGEVLPDLLRKLRVTAVTLGGLALGDGEENKLCVDSTAVDLFKEGFDVTVVTDAVEAVLPENRAKSLQNMAALGIKLATTAEVRALVKKAYA